MSAINPVTTPSYVPPVSGPSTANASSHPAEHSEQQDLIVLSLAGRIALGVGAGRLSSNQARELTSELKTIIHTPATDRGKLESQLSQEIYGDGHNGAPIPEDLKATPAIARDIVQAGRIVVQESADNITHSQASQLFVQMKQIYEQSQDGASAAATNAAQNQLSVEIYDAAHNITPTPKQ